MKAFTQIVHYLSVIVYISTNLTVLWYAFPSYKKYRKPAFLLWSIGSALCIFTEIFDWTIGRQHMTTAQYYFYYDARQLTFYTAAITSVIGTLLFIKEYNRIRATKNTEQGAAANP